jgi:hypothetical protein
VHHIAIIAHSLDDMSNNGGSALFTGFPVAQVDEQQ